MKSMYLKDSGLDLKLKKYESFSNYSYEINNDIINFYNEWKNEYKQMFIKEVSAFILEKYNIDILKIYPNLNNIGGYYYDIIDDLRKIKSIDQDILFNLAKDIDKIYNNVYFSKVHLYLNENIDYFNEKIQYLEKNLKILTVQYDISRDINNIIWCIKINLLPKIDDIYYDNVYDYIINILNIKYNYAGNSLDEIINNVDKNQKAEIITVISDLLNQIQQDFDYFQIWKKEIRKAMR